MAVLDQTASGSGNGAVTYPVPAAGSMAIAAGSVVLVTTHVSNTGTAVPTATGLTFVQVGTDLTSSNGVSRLYRAYTAVALPTAVITITTTTNPQSSAIADTYTGADPSGTNGSGAIGATNTFTSAGSAAPTANVTTTRDNSLVVGYAGETGALTWTVGSGYTLNNSIAGPGFSTSASERKAVPASGTVTTGNFALSGSGAVDMFVVEILNVPGGASGVYRPVKIANRNVGPMALRHNFHPPVPPQSSAPPVNNNQNFTGGLSFTGGMQKQTNKRFNVEFNIGGKFGVHVATNPTIYFDDFNDNNMDILWSGASSADPSRVVEQNQRIEITHSTGPQYNQMTANFQSYNLTGKNSYVQITDAGNQALLSHQAIFGTQIDGNNKVFIAINQNFINAWKVVTGTQTQIGSSVAYNASTMQYFRISESGGTISFDTAPDNAGVPGTWTNRWTVANPIAVTAIYPFVQAGCYSTEATASYAYFDNFQLPDVSASSDLAVYQALIGRKVSYVNYFVAWGSSSGYQNFQRSVAKGIADNGSIPVLTWESWVAGGGPTQSTYSLSNILAGNFDTYINKFANDIKVYGGPVYIRLNHEMNGTWYPWAEGVNGNTTGQYANAWRYIVKKFMAAGVTNVKWIWCVNTDFPTSISIAGLYPGDDYVDIAGLDLYNWGTALPAGWQSFATVMGTTYANILAVASNKPMWIIELGSGEAGGDKAAWIKDFFDTQLGVYSRIQTWLWFEEYSVSGTPADPRIVTSPAATTAYIKGINGFTGKLIGLPGKNFAAVLSFAGAFVKLPRKAMTGVLSFTGNLSQGKNFVRAFTAGLSFTGNLNRSIARQLIGGLSFTGSMIKSARRQLTGVLSFTGNMVIRTVRSLAGSLSFTGAFATMKFLTRSLTGVLSFTGAMSKSSNKQLTGSLTFVGALQRTSSRAFAATLTFAGNLAKKTLKTFAAGLSFTGSLLRFIAKSFTAALSFTGAMVKTTFRSLTGGLSFVGAWANHSVLTRAFTGSLSFTGAFSKQTNKVFAAGLSFTGSIGRAVRHGMTAALTFTGSLIKTTFRSLTGVLSFVGNLAALNGRTFLGALSFTGSLRRTPNKSLNGSLSFTGSILRFISYPMTAAVTFTGNLNRVAARAFTAALSFTGSLLKSARRQFTAVLSFAGTISRQVRHGLTGTLSFTGSLAKTTAKFFTGAVSFVGTWSNHSVLTRAFTGSLSFTGAMTKQTNKVLAGSLSFAGSLARRAARSLTAALSFTGAIVKQTRKSLIAGLSFTGALKRIGGRTFNGNLNFTGNLNRRSTHFFTAALGLTGNLAKQTRKAFTATIDFVGDFTAFIQPLFHQAVNFVLFTIKMLRPLFTIRRKAPVIHYTTQKPLPVIVRNKVQTATEAKPIILTITSRKTIIKVTVKGINDGNSA